MLDSTNNQLTHIVESQLWGMYNTAETQLQRPSFEQHCRDAAAVAKPQERRVKQSRRCTVCRCDGGVCFAWGCMIQAGVSLGGRAIREPRSRCETEHVQLGMCVCDQRITTTALLRACGHRLSPPCRYPLPHAPMHRVMACT